MATAAQITANQTNSKLSTGPRTPEGKHAAARNSTPHGLTSKTVVLNSEDQAEYDALRVSNDEYFGPATNYEKELARLLTDAQWRLLRCRRAEAAFFDKAIADVQEQETGLSADEAMARLFTDDAHANKMRLFLRYQSAIEREYWRTLRELERIVTARLDAEARREELRLMRAASARRSAMFDSDSPSPSPEIGFVSQPPRPAAPKATSASGPVTSGC